MKQYSADLCTVWTCSSPTRWHRKKKKPQQTQTFGKRCAAVGRARSSNLKPRAFPPKLQASLEQRPGAASLSSNSRIHQHYSEISCSNEIFFCRLLEKRGGARSTPCVYTDVRVQTALLGDGEAPSPGRWSPSHLIPSPSLNLGQNKASSRGFSIPTSGAFPTSVAFDAFSLPFPLILIFFPPFSF